jgi:uncharacterized protein
MLPIPNTIPRLSPNTFKNKKSSTDTSTGASLFGGNSVQEAPSIQEKPKFSFNELLEEIAPSNQESTRDINLLWKDLPDLERNLIHTRSPIALENYKEHIKILLTTILAKNVRVGKSFTPIKGSTAKKEFSHLEYINSKLKLLAETITHPQNSAFQILKQLDNIKGFLLDVKL